MKKLKALVQINWDNLAYIYPEKVKFIERHYGNPIDELTNCFAMFDDNCNELNIAKFIKNQLHNPYKWGISIEDVLSDPRFKDMMAMLVTVPVLDPEHGHDATTPFLGKYHDEFNEVLEILNMDWDTYSNNDWNFITYRVAEFVCENWKLEYDLDTLVDENRDWVETIVDCKQLRKDLFDRCRQMVDKKVGPCPTKINDNLTVDLRQGVIKSLYHDLFFDPQTFDFFLDVIDIAKGENSDNIEYARKAIEQKYFE